MTQKTVFNAVLLLVLLAAAAPVPAAPDALPPLLPVTRIYTGADGLTRFGEGAVPVAQRDFAPPTPPISVSPNLPAQGLMFATLPSGWFGDWHPAPQRQYVIMLRGTFEIETGDGASRRFEPGTTFLLEDTTGKGHRTRVVSETPVVIALVPVPEHDAQNPD